MAAGFARELSGDDVLILSGGSEPADSVNPIAVEVMNEVGIDISTLWSRWVVVIRVRISRESDMWTGHSMIQKESR
jgi:arsenate reductase